MSVPSVDPVVIVSADGHAAPPLEAYRPYLPSEYHAQLDEFIADEGAAYEAMLAAPAFPSAEERSTFDHRDALVNGGTDGSWDWAVRRRELDIEGCSAEIVHSGTQASPTLWYGIVNRRRSPELRALGTRTWHRWLADLLDEADGRMFGVAEPGPCLDIEASVRELEWAADHRFVSVGVPGICHDPELPPLHDGHFDPFWSTCEQRGLALSMHAGWGQPQGVFYDFFERFVAAQAVMGQTSGESPSLKGPSRPNWRRHSSTLRRSRRCDSTSGRAVRCGS